MAVKHVTIYECDNCGEQEKGNPDLVSFELGLDPKKDLCRACAKAVREALRDMQPKPMAAPEDREDA